MPNPAPEKPPQPLTDPTAPPKDIPAEEAPNRTGDGEWQPGGDPRHSPKD